MKHVHVQKQCRRLIVGAAVAISLFSMTGQAAQSVAAGETTLRIRRALEQLPYYGVFDFLAYTNDRGTVTLLGYAYQGNLKGHAANAVKRVSGVDEVANKN